MKRCEEKNCAEKTELTEQKMQSYYKAILIEIATEPDNELLKKIQAASSCVDRFQAKALRCSVRNVWRRHVNAFTLYTACMRELANQ